MSAVPLFVYPSFNYPLTLEKATVQELEVARTALEAFLVEFEEQKALVYGEKEFNEIKKEVTDQIASYTQQIEKLTVMNFSEIIQGNYRSLLGEWEEVALSMNLKDGRGDTWMPSEGTSLVVSNQTIERPGMLLQGSVLDDGMNHSVLFSEKEGYLVGDTRDGAIIWSVFFYPKGVEMSGFGTDLPTSIDDSKERIVIRTSNHSILQVFERKGISIPEEASEVESGANQVSMNLTEILTSTYTSINGTWKNDIGNQIVITGNTMDFSDVTGQNHPGQLVGTQLNIPNLNDENGKPALLPYITDDYFLPAYGQELSFGEYNGVHYLSGGFHGAVYYLSFLPSGVMGSLMAGDQSREKIVSVGTQNDPTLVEEKQIYYRVD